MTTNFQDDIPHLKYKIYLKVQNVDGFIRHQVVMLLYVSKVPIVVCLTSAGPKILTEVETLGERCSESHITFTLTKEPLTCVRNETITKTH